MALTHSALCAGLSPRAQAQIGLKAYRIALQRLQQDRIGNGGVSEAEANAMKDEFRRVGGGGLIFDARDLLCRHGYREILERYEVPMTPEELAQAVENSDRVQDIIKNDFQEPVS